MSKKFVLVSDTHCQVVCRGFVNKVIEMNFLGKFLILSSKNDEPEFFIVVGNKTENFWGISWDFRLLCYDFQELGLTDVLFNKNEITKNGKSFVEVYMRSNK